MIRIIFNENIWGGGFSKKRKISEGFSKEVKIFEGDDDFPRRWWFSKEMKMFKGDLVFRRRCWFSKEMKIFKGDEDFWRRWRFRAKMMNKKLLPPCWLTPPRCEQLSPDQDFAIAASNQLSFEKIPIGSNLIFDKTGAPWFIGNGGISEKTSFISCTKLV